MTIDGQAELAKTIHSLIAMVRTDGIQDFSARNGLESSALCGLRVATDDAENCMITAHDLDVTLRRLPSVNDNDGRNKLLLSVSFKRGTVQTVMQWHRELASFRAATTLHSA